MANIFFIIVGLVFSFAVLMTMTLLMMQCEVRGWLGVISQEGECITVMRVLLVVVGVIMVLFLLILLLVNPGMVHHGDVAEADITWYWCY